MNGAEGPPGSDGDPGTNGNAGSPGPTGSPVSGLCSSVVSKLST